MEKYIIGTFDLMNITFAENKNNFGIFIKDNDYKKMTLKTPIIKIPFGIQEYFHKDIINIEMTNYETNNYVYNFFTTLKQIDTFFKNLQNDDFINNLNYSVSPTFKESIKGKNYLSCIKMRDKFDPLYRTLTKKRGSVILTKFYDKDNKEINPFNIKNRKGSMELELAFLWTTKTDYGISWFLNNAELF